MTTNKDDTIILRFFSRKEHESFCQFTGAGGCFIEKRTSSGRIQILCKVSRYIQRYGEIVPNPAYLDFRTGKPLRGAHVTPDERAELERAGDPTSFLRRANANVKITPTNSLAITRQSQ